MSSNLFLSSSFIDSDLTDPIEESDRHGEDHHSAKPLLIRPSSALAIGGGGRRGGGLTLSREEAESGMEEEASLVDHLSRSTGAPDKRRQQGSLHYNPVAQR